MIKNITIISFVLKNIYDMFLTYLNIKGQDRELPENVKDVYNEEEFNKWKQYNKENIKLGIIEDVLSFILNFVLLVFNIYALFFYSFNGNDYFRYFYVVLILSILSSIISIPINYYDTFVIEEKYGMNKTTIKTFILDILKPFPIEIIMTLLPVYIIKFLYDKYGNNGALIIIFSIVAISLLLSVFIMQLLKIFNKFTPLEDSELKDKLINLCEKYNIKVKKIVVKDASRRTTNANAFCTGLGKKKTISLDDNLLNNYSTNQIIAVFAHEFAHAKNKHTIKQLPLGIFRIVLILSLIIFLLNFNELSFAFGFNETNYLIIFLILGILIWPIDIILDFISNCISRCYEYEADLFAAKEGFGEDLISALKQLNKESLSTINPHPLIVKLTYSHPTLSQRISAIRKQKD